MLHESVHIDQAYQLSDKILKENHGMPGYQLLTVIFTSSNLLSDRRDYIGAMAGYERILDMIKPDSLLYWDIKARLASSQFIQTLMIVSKQKTGCEKRKR